jgi:hypothetical protein
VNRNRQSLVNPSLKALEAVLTESLRPWQAPGQVRDLIGQGWLRVHANTSCPNIQPKIDEEWYY